MYRRRTPTPSSITRDAVSIFQKHPKRSKPPSSGSHSFLHSQKPLLSAGLLPALILREREREREALQYPSPAGREKSMCPLRFILVFFSAVLAGYFAWRTARSSQETGFTSLEDDSNLENLPPKDHQHLCFKRVRAYSNLFFLFFPLGSNSCLNASGALCFFFFPVSFLLFRLVQRRKCDNQFIYTTHLNVRTGAFIHYKRMKITNYICMVICPTT